MLLLKGKMDITKLNGILTEAETNRKKIRDDIIKLGYNIEFETNYPNTIEIYKMNGTINDCINKCTSTQNCKGFLRNENSKDCMLKGDDVLLYNKEYNNLLNYYYKK